MSLNVPTMAEVERSRGRACPKGIPTPILKAEKQKTKAAAEAAFRKAVWTRDKSRSRASGKPLAKSGSDRMKVGEVHHVLKRSTHPEERLNPSNGILLSRAEHQLAETACPADPSHQLLDIIGPADLAQPQTFTWRNAAGAITKTRVG